MAKTDLSIVIVSYNTKDITKKCLDSIFASLKNSKLAYEIVIVDNNSQDGSVHMLLDYNQIQDRIITLKLNEENLGFGKGSNQGVKIARGKYILLLNSDTVVLNNAIEVLYRYSETNPHVHFAGGKLLNKDKSPQPSCGPFYYLPVVFAALFLRGDYWGLTRQSPTQIKKVDWVSGACIITKKEYFEKLKGFDEGIFMYMEEIDLLMRAHKAGYNTYFNPDAQFIHLGSASSGGKTYPILQVYKGFLYLYKKHFSKTSLFWLKTMLKLKAYLSFYIGRIVKNSYLTETYEQALKLVETG